MWRFPAADLRVDATGAPAFAATGTALKLQAAGNYLYGAPAAGLKVQAKADITTDDAPVHGVSGYQFGLLNDTPAMWQMISRWCGRSARSDHAAETCRRAS